MGTSCISVEKWNHRRYHAWKNDQNHSRKRRAMTHANTLFLSVLLLLASLTVPGKSCQAEPAIPRDKVLHTSFSLVIGIAAYDFYRKNTTLSTAQARAAAFASTLLVGVAKELTDDEFDWGDMAANGVGAAIGVMIRF